MSSQVATLFFCSTQALRSMLTSQLDPLFLGVIQVGLFFSVCRPGRRLIFLFDTGCSANLGCDSALFSVCRPGRHLIFLLDAGRSANVDIPGRPLILDVIQVVLSACFRPGRHLIFLLDAGRLANVDIPGRPLVVRPMWISQVDPLFWMWFSFVQRLPPGASPYF